MEAAVAVAIVNLAGLVALILRDVVRDYRRRNERRANPPDVPPSPPTPPIIPPSLQIGIPSYPLGGRPSPK